LRLGQVSGFSTFAKGDTSDEYVHIPRDLLERLLQTEAAHLAQKKLRPVYMHEILDAIQPHRAAKFMHTELPKRYAVRLRMIEELPGFAKIPELQEHHDQLTSWYEDMRLVRRSQEVGLKDFTACVKKVRSEGRNTVRLVTLGLQKLRSLSGSCTPDVHSKHFTEEKMNEWLNGFLLLRIGTNMLLDQFLSICPVEDGGRGMPTGIVVEDCCPTDVCQRAATAARNLCEMYAGKAPRVEVETFVVDRQGPQVGSEHRITYIPAYLRYIMLEILKNSVAATVKNAVDEADLASRPVKVLVSIDQEHVAIRVSDRAGGIPHHQVPRVWSYLYGAAAQHEPDQASPVKATPLSGYGVGLPLGRLHARYLGGDMRIATFAGYGTDVYLHLPSIASNQLEKIGYSSLDDHPTWNPTSMDELPHYKH